MAARPISQVMPESLCHIGSRGRALAWSPHGILAVASSKAVRFLIHDGGSSDRASSLLVLHQVRLPFDDCFGVSWNSSLVPDAHPPAAHLCVAGRSHVYGIRVTRESAIAVQTDSWSPYLDQRHAPLRRKRPRADADDARHEAVIGAFWLDAARLIIVVAYPSSASVLLSTPSSRNTVVWTSANGVVVLSSHLAVSSSGSTVLALSLSNASFTLIDSSASWSEMLTVALPTLASSISATFTDSDDIEVLSAGSLSFDRTCVSFHETSSLDKKRQPTIRQRIQGVLPHMRVTSVQLLAGAAIVVGSSGVGVVTFTSDTGLYESVISVVPKRCNTVSGTKALIGEVHCVVLDPVLRLVVLSASLLYKHYESSLITFDRLSPLTPLAIRRMLATERALFGSIFFEPAAALRATWHLSAVGNEELDVVLARYIDLKKQNSSLLRELARGSHPLAPLLRALMIHAAERSTINPCFGGMIQWAPQTRPQKLFIDCVAELVLPHALRAISVSARPSPDGALIAQGAAQWLSVYLDWAEDAGSELTTPAFTAAVRDRLHQYSSVCDPMLVNPNVVLQCPICADVSLRQLDVTLRGICPPPKEHKVLVSPSSFQVIPISIQEIVALRCTLCGCGEALSHELPRPLCVVCGGILAA